MLHVFPLLAVLAGDVIVRLRARSVAAFRALAAVLVLAALHNAPACVTRYGGFSPDEAGPACRAACLESAPYER